MVIGCAAGGIGEIAAIRVGATHSHRIAQGVRAELTLHKPTPIQLDGEPWLQVRANQEGVYRGSRGGLEGV
jgi:hypothetical protein